MCCYRFECGGKELAKVLYYHGLICDTESAEQKIVCPFHDDVNPSMVVDLIKGKYFCFGCNCAGDAFEFVKKMYPDLNDLQAGLKYFEILKSNKVNKIKIAKSRRHKKDNVQALIEAMDYYYGLSKIDWLEDKTKEVLECKKYMMQRGFNVNMLNYCRAKVTYNDSYPIIFPLLDNGKFSGWVCRTDKAEIEKKRKYLYNDGFSRSNTLVGTYGNNEYVIVVEGYMDRLRMLQNLRSYGIKEDIVAILGWKMSDGQIEKLKKKIKYVISALDNDECGRKGTEYLKTKFNVVRFCYLKGIKDPGMMDSEQFIRMYHKTIQKWLELKQNRVIGT